MFVAALAAGCGGGGGEETSRSPKTSTSDDRPRRAEQPHPPRPESSLRFLRSRQEAAGADARLTDAARAMLPADVTVWCWNETVWSEAERRLAQEIGEKGAEFGGIADPYAYDIHLDGWVCDELAALEPGSDDDELAQADALSIFTHETRHFSSTGSLEAATECAALQRMDEMGAALGASEEHREKLQRLAWEELYPTLPQEYRSAECKAGGVLDREPETPEFP